MSELYTTGVANAAIAAGLCVVINSAVADGVKLPAAATDELFGVVTSGSTASGQAVTVQTDGIAKITAAGTIARGDSVELDTAGKVVTAAGAGTHVCVGQALIGGASGDTVTVFLKRHTVTIAP